MLGSIPFTSLAHHLLAYKHHAQSLTNPTDARQSLVQKRIGAPERLVAVTSKRLTFPEFVDFAGHDLLHDVWGRSPLLWRGEMRRMMVMVGDGVCESRGSEWADRRPGSQWQES